MKFSKVMTLPEVSSMLKFVSGTFDLFLFLNNTKKGDFDYTVNESTLLTTNSREHVFREK